jgi:RNA polymerase sigma-70 factor (ECF subfamily)
LMEGEREREIACGLREGDVAAWQALYDAYARPLWGLVARWMGPSSTEIADVVQETFMAAARSATTYDPKRASLWLWLCGIARRHAAQHHRNRARHGRVTAAESVRAADLRISRRLENRENPPDEALESAERAAQVRAALLVLPGEYEVLLTEKYVDGASLAELSQRHGSSETAVRSKLARARRAFRRIYERASPASKRGSGGGTA